MKQVIFHIGTYKTATTYMQDIFHDNFKNASRLFHYPFTGLYYKAHHYLATPEFPGWENGVSIDQFQKTWNDLVQEIRESRTGTIVLSSEMFCSIKDEHLQMIKEVLCGHELRAIVYLRPQEEYIASLALQLIKGCNGKPEAYASLKNAIEYSSIPRFVDYPGICKRWESAVGNGNLTVRPFEKEQFHNGDIASDFVHYLFGVDMPGELKFPTKNLNPRLSRDALEFKILVNQLPITRDEKNAIVPALLKFSSASVKCKCLFPDQHDLLPLAEKEAIRQKFSKDNDYIAKTYLGRNAGESLFNTNISDTSECVAYPGLSAESIASIIEFINNDSPKVLDPIRISLKKLLQEDNRKFKHFESFMR